MDAGRGGKSASWWGAIVLFAISLLAMGASLALLVWVAAAPAGGNIVIAALPTLYVAVVAFLISTLLKPHKRRALWFAGLGGLFLTLFFFDLLKGTPFLRLWPIYAPVRS